MDINKLKDWIFNGDTGLSSMTMASALLGVRMVDHAHPPYDIVDFKRCHDFAKYVGMTHEDFQTVIAVYPWWKHVYNVWHDCEMALEKRDARFIRMVLEDCYNKIQQKV